MAADDQLTVRLRHLAAIVHAENQIFDTTESAFRVWLPMVEAAVLHGTAPGTSQIVAAINDDEIYSINPDAAESTRAAWAEQVEEILAVIGAAWLLHYRKTGAGLATEKARRDAYLSDVRSRLQAIPNRIFGAIRRVVDEGTLKALNLRELAGLVREELKLSNLKDRALTISRTEGVAVFNGGRQTGFTQVTRETGQAYTKTWLTIHDSRARLTHLEASGQRVAGDAKFAVGGFAADYPGDPALPAHEAINCRCSATYSSSGVVATIGEPMNAESLVASIVANFEADGQLPNGWRGRMAPIGSPTGDGRQLNVPEGGLRFRQMPITFDWAPSREGGHDGAMMAGRIDRAWEADGYLWGEGALDVNGTAGAEYARQLAEGFAYTVSVDPDQVTFEQHFVNGDGEQVAFDEATVVGEDGEPHLRDGFKILDVMTDWRLAGVTAVQIPAFDEARIEPVYGYVSPDFAKLSGETVEILPTLEELGEMLDAYDGDDESDLAEMARAIKARRAYDAETGHSSEEGDYSLVATVTGSLSYPVFAERKRKWDGHTARQNVAKWASSDGSGDPTKINWTKFSKAFLYRGKPESGNALLAADEKAKGGYRVEDFKLGFVDIIDGKPHIVANAIIGLAGGHGVQATNIPGPEKKAILGKLKTLYGKARASFPEFPDFPFAAETEDALVASTGQVFAAESFANPKFTGPTPLTIVRDDDGRTRVFGHVALWGSCYMSMGADPNRPCVSIPFSQTDYARYRVHGARLADGSVMPVGAITFGDGHRSAGGLRASMKLYADVATVAAKVVPGEDEFGVWVAGEVLDSFSDRADDLLLSPLSGHWEPDQDVDGQLEMLAAHVVVVPGFKVPRLVATIGDDGEIVAFEASGPFTFLEKSAEMFDAAVGSGEIEVVGEREDGVVLYDEALVAAVMADRKAQRALRKLGVDPDSRASAALARLGMRD